MRLSPGIKELLRYILVGSLAVTIDTIAYFLLSGTTSLSVATSKRISFVLGSIWAFFANKYFTFRQPEQRIKEPLLFAIVYIVGFLSNSFVHDNIFHVSGSKIFAFTTATFISICLNYIGQKWLVFRTRS